MISNSSIKNEVKKHAEQLAVSEKCPNCGTIGLEVGGVYTMINLLPKPITPKPGAKPTLRGPDSYPVELICPNCAFRRYDVKETLH